MNKTAIEQKVRELHRHIWENKEALWPQGAPEPINMLHPRIGAHVAGLTYEEIDKFSGQPFTQRKVGMKFAGQLDRARKSIVVSREFGPETARFTGAHELGHYFLHQGKGMFRDRPTTYGAASGPRNIVEREADYYGACYVMPAPLVVDEFEFRFGPTPLTFDTNIAFHLNPVHGELLFHAMYQ